ncbi:hypothetical protein E3T23_02810 [Cryobacterium cheniae]|uniref:Uncharacterized protein n=1 Tax=Cryobacterium cheniae TaxID=1259262 RepID=A0A4R8XWZ7_9MICO|nr:hypothetical protein [Cryobacterium cheniae]TFC83316.1 hypothetical protein E3T23_02810 [Cryobacterium cheniae]
MLTDGFWRDLLLVGAGVVGSLMTLFVTQVGKLGDRAYGRKQDLRAQGVKSSQDCLDQLRDLDESLHKQTPSAADNFVLDVDLPMVRKIRASADLVPDKTLRDSVRHGMNALTGIRATNSMGTMTAATAAQEQKQLLSYTRQVVAAFVRGENSPGGPVQRLKESDEKTIAASEEMYGPARK